LCLKPKVAIINLLPTNAVVIRVSRRQRASVYHKIA